MTVKELKELLNNIDENIMVLIPISQEFDGAFYSPCSKDSGISVMGTDMTLDESDIKEMELLNKPMPENDVFLLIPCGFTDEKDHTHLLN